MDGGVGGARITIHVSSSPSIDDFQHSYGLALTGGFPDV
jgi:hypothetical protein